jgi:hypothetical protein
MFYTAAVDLLPQAGQLENIYGDRHKLGHYWLSALENLGGKKSEPHPPPPKKPTTLNMDIIVLSVEVTVFH